jgi:Zn-dependent oligopeptidase
LLCTVYEPYRGWEGADQDDLFISQSQWIRKELKEYAQSVDADNEYLYMDYADVDQDPLGSYGPENIRKMKAAAKKYDPEGVFQKLVAGGFKISKVS